MRGLPMSGVVLLVGAPLVAVTAFVVARSRISPGASPPAAISASTQETAEPLADWCAPGFEPIDRAGCFASFAPHAGQPLIVYLHGRYARDVASDEIDRQRRLGARATARGFAVLALRGRLGECVAPELADWFCWPSNDKNADHAPGFVDGWTRALAIAHERTGSPARFLLGFSNGGYFAGLIATRRLLAVDALVVAHGGPVETPQAVPASPPILLLSADDDVAQDDMIRLEEQLVRASWAHDSYARAGGHALTDEDIDAALTFFARAKERLPLDPPLPMHRPVRHERDAAAASDSSQEPAIALPSPVADPDEPPRIDKVDEIEDQPSP